MQVYSLKAPLRTPRKPKPSPSKPAQSPHEVFEGVMGLNAKHGHPSVQVRLPPPWRAWVAKVLTRGALSIRLQALSVR